MNYTVILIFFLFICIFTYGIIVGILQTRMPIFIISLERRQNRREVLLKNIKSSIHYYVAQIYANDGQKTVEKFIERPGEVGCFMSHLYMWKYFLLNTNNKYALVLEDDADIHLPEQWILIEKCLRTAPKDWDIIWLGATRILQPEMNTPVNEYLMYNGSKIWGTHAYLVSRKGAMNLYNSYKYLQTLNRVEYFKQIMPIDVLVSERSDINQYIISPHYMVGQLKYMSDTRS